MALVLGWLKIAGYGGRKGQVQKGFPGNKACGGRGGGGGEGKVYAITPPATTKK